jgi:hypothetical protein
MRGNEARYGYVLTAELLVVAILNLTVTHGKGAPAHPQTTFSVIGLVAALVLIPLLRTDNRMIVGFGSIVVAYLVCGLPRTPNSLTYVHTITIAITLVYTLLLTQRQRRQASAELKERRAAGPARDPKARDSKSKPLGRKRKEPEELPGPRPSRRYTPPKSKRSPTGKTGRR